MKYLLLGWILWPLFAVLRFLFPIHPGRRLIMQTGKIGDWINSTPLICQLAPVDVVFAPICQPLIRYDQHIQQRFIMPPRSGLFFKLRLAISLFCRGYESVLILMPNMPNTFIARLACARHTASLDTYRTSRAVRLLGAGFARVCHTRDDLVLDDYLRLAGITPGSEFRRKHATFPLHVPAFSLIRPGQKFRVGVSLSAGNPLKTMPTEIWLRLFTLLESADTEVYVFGLGDERSYLEALLTDKSASSNLTVIDCLDQVALENLPWHIGQMHLYLSTDTGNSYIADALDVPLINFAGPCYMPEQRPLGMNALIVETKGLEAFSFIFAAPYASKLLPEQLYTYSEAQFLEIGRFIEDCRKAVR